MSNPVFSDFDDLLNAALDDIADLPPIGVPPTGSYDLVVTGSRESSSTGGSDYFKLSYTITNVNEVKDAEESAEVRTGQTFNEMFSPFKKDGSVNDMGLGTLKARIAPFATYFNTPTIGATMQAVQQVNITAKVVRRPDRKEEGRFRFNLEDVVIL